MAKQDNSMDIEGMNYCLNISYILRSMFTLLHLRTLFSVLWRYLYEKLSFALSIMFALLTMLDELMEFR